MGCFTFRRWGASRRPACALRWAAGALARPNERHCKTSMFRYGGALPPLPHPANPVRTRCTLRSWSRSRSRSPSPGSRCAFGSWLLCSESAVVPGACVERRTRVGSGRTRGDGDGDGDWGQTRGGGGVYASVVVGRSDAVRPSMPMEIESAQARMCGRSHPHRRFAAHHSTY